MKLELNELIAQCQKFSPKRVAVAAAGDAAVLQAVSEASRVGIVLPVLCGDVEKIDFEARLHNIDISSFEIVDADSDTQAISIAVSLVEGGKADFLMKGLVQTADLLRCVLDKENGLRTGNKLSHVALIDSPSLDRTLFMTDGVFVPYPDLDTKVHLINNAVATAKGLGIDCPLVAPLAPLELVNPDMEATLDAASLTQMNRRGQIPGCIVDGPLALDAAISPEAAKLKRIDSPVAGKADILLFHSIDAGNSTLKAFTACGCLMGGVVMGATAPIILNSRSATPDSKLYSIAIAALLSNNTQKINTL